jgi:hypothetical protein
MTWDGVRLSFGGSDGGSGVFLCLPGSGESAGGLVALPFAKVDDGSKWAHETSV